MSKLKRTELDRQIELRQGIENRVYSIFYDAVKNQNSFDDILNNLTCYKRHIAEDFKKLPRYMRSEISGAEHALFRIIEWWFVQSRYSAPNLPKISQFLSQEDIKRMGISWSEVTYLGSFWRKEPNKPYSLVAKENEK